MSSGIGINISISCCEASDRPNLGFAPSTDLMTDKALSNLGFVVSSSSHTIIISLSFFFAYIHPIVIFISIIILLIETFKKDAYLLFAILTYVFSIGYLEPYNSSLDFPQWNAFSILSVILFLIFTIRKTLLSKEEV